jgi:hypothetical protein
MLLIYRPHAMMVHGMVVTDGADMADDRMPGPAGVKFMPGNPKALRGQLLDSQGSQ